jgi:hypothetical protein
MRVDNALMELAELNRAALALVADREPPADERMRRLAQIIYHAHQAAGELKEIRKT